METQCVYYELGTELVYELQALNWLTVLAVCEIHYYCLGPSRDRVIFLHYQLRSQPYVYSTGISRHAVCMRLAVHWRVL
jgi:hypothetical protein